MALIKSRGKVVMDQIPFGILSCWTFWIIKLSFSNVPFLPNCSNYPLGNLIIGFKLLIFTTYTNTFFFLGNPSVTSCYMLMFPISQSSFIKLKHTTLGPRNVIHNCSHLTYNHNLQTIRWQILDRSLTYSQTSLIVRECPSPFNIP